MSNDLYSTLQRLWGNIKLQEPYYCIKFYPTKNFTSERVRSYFFFFENLDEILSISISNPTKSKSFVQKWTLFHLSFQYPMIKIHFVFYFRLSSTCCFTIRTLSEENILGEYHILAVILYMFHVIFLAMKLQIFIPAFRVMWWEILPVPLKLRLEKRFLEKSRCFNFTHELYCYYQQCPIFCTVFNKRRYFARSLTTLQILRQIV